jgi:hypothetical protein
MPGACAYLTLANLISGPARLESYGMNPEAIISILDYFRFCELGAVSPDYLIWISFIMMLPLGADRMHYERTGNMIKAGVNLVKKLDDASQQKAFSWLRDMPVTNGGYTRKIKANTGSARTRCGCITIT